MVHVSEEIFASTAPFYARYRAGYAPDLFAHLIRRFVLNGRQRVLDLGTGTGAIAIGLASHVREVVAVDPESGMLAEGRRLAAERGIGTIDWRLGDSQRLSSMDLGTFDLAVLAQSFHWTDRERLLVQFHDMLLSPDGAVIIVGGPPPGTETPAPWTEVVTEIRTRYLGPQRRAGSATYSHPTETHAEVIARSSFSQLEVVQWEHAVARTRDDIIGLQLSYSYSSPAQLGEARPHFERDLRAALDALEPSGNFVENIRTEAIIAVRPHT